MIEVPDRHEIEAEIEKAIDMKDRSENPYWGMTYIDGVLDALDWVTGNTDQPPLS